MTDQTWLQGPAWTALLDDAARVGSGADPDSAGLAAAHEERRTSSGALVGALVVRDTDLPSLQGVTHPLRVVLSTGAGGIAGPLALAARSGLTVRAVQVSLRDVGDLAGNARRVVAAVEAVRDELTDLDWDELAVHVELPTDLAGAVTGGWARAADEVAAAELALHLDLVEAAATTPQRVLERTAEWIDAALDRETPFSLTTRRGFSEGHEIGAANLLLATRRAFDGVGRDEVRAILAGHDREALLADLRSEEYLPATRRWLTSVLVPDVVATAGELHHGSVR